MHRARDVTLLPFVVFADVDQSELLAGVDALLHFSDVGFLDARLGIVDQSEKGGSVLHGFFSDSYYFTAAAISPRSRRGHRERHGYKILIMEAAMKPRINYLHAAPAGYKALLGLEQYVRSSGIEPKTLELLKIRASQINGCAYCIDMHTKDARAAGETEQRIYALNAWRETPFFSNRERAALAWTEAVTRIGNGVADSLFEEARAEFSEKELVDLTWAVAAI